MKRSVHVQRCELRGAKSETLTVQCQVLLLIKNPQIGSAHRVTLPRIDPTFIYSHCQRAGERLLMYHVHTTYQFWRLQSTMCSHSQNQKHYPELNYGSGAKWIKGLTQNRLSTFLGGHFEDVNLSSVLYTHRIDGSHHVDLQVWSAPGLTKPSFQEATKQEFKPAKKGDSFGPSCKSLSYSAFFLMPNFSLQGYDDTI